MADFDRFLTNFMTGDRYAKQRAAIRLQYPASEYFGSTGPWSRAHDVIQDSSFICNTRFLYDAYHIIDPPTPTYMMAYDYGEDLQMTTHASDLLPTFFNRDVQLPAFAAFLRKYVDSTLCDFQIDLAWNAVKMLYPSYQGYMASFAVKGRHHLVDNSVWKQATIADQLGQVMEVSIEDMFNGTYTDVANTETICNFWRNMSSRVENTAKSQYVLDLVQQG